MWLVNFLFLAEWVRAPVGAMLLGIWRLMGKTGWCTKPLHICFFGLQNKPWKINRNRIVRTSCQSFQPWFIDLKTQQQNETKIWKLYWCRPCFRGVLLRFRLLCHPSYISTLGGFLQAPGSTLHRGRWTVVKGLLKRRGRRGWNLHLQCSNKNLLLKLPMGKNIIQSLPSLYCKVCASKTSWQQCKLCWKNPIHDADLEHIEKWPPLE